MEPVLKRETTLNHRQEQGIVFSRKESRRRWTSRSVRHSARTQPPQRSKMHLNMDERSTNDVEWDDKADKCRYAWVILHATMNIPEERASTKIRDTRYFQQKTRQREPMQCNKMLPWRNIRKRCYLQKNNRS